MKEREEALKIFEREIEYWKSLENVENLYRYLSVGVLIHLRHLKVLYTKLVEVRE